MTRSPLAAMGAVERTVSIDRLFERLIFDPETGIFAWKHRPVGDFANADAMKEFRRWNGRYAGTAAFQQVEGGRSFVGRIDGKRLKAHRVAWAMGHGSWPDGEIDHIDRDPMNNRLANLRIATRRGNCANKKVSPSASSPFMGVYLHRKSGKWAATISCDQRSKHLGLFVSEADAARSYDAAAKLIHGDFAALNFGDKL